MDVNQSGARVDRKRKQAGQDSKPEKKRRNSIPTCQYDLADYTVGWICALTTEYVAAQSFLDEKHEKPSTQVHDDNNYTVGRVGKHLVVIAAMPSGEYGKSSATAVAKDILRSFPNIRVGLMVGIGGGAPSSSNDVRLGDIVVGVPGNGRGGVLQYDLGKKIQGQSFHITGFLNTPPSVLLTAVSGLSARYELEGHKLEDRIDDVLANNPRLRRKYRRPDSKTDRLFHSHVVHHEQGKACDIICGGDPLELVARPARTADDDNPAIHYGLIASGDSLIKDAIFRDELAAEHGVLCVEMEAAGLMNQFPCLVIRGICDYSDSHKNKEWQGYAAMSAAAYAKDLLSEVPPAKVEATMKIIEIPGLLSSIEKNVNQIRRTVEDTNDKIHQIGGRIKKDDISRWLSPPDPSINHTKALQQRHENSGAWLLERDEFLRWRTQQNSFLWLYGIPGCGKTIMSSTVIQSLANDPAYTPLLYFYFDFADYGKQTLEHMLRSLISQLYYKSESASQHLDTLHSHCENGRQQPTLQSLSETFLIMMEQAQEVWLVVDALDECSSRKAPSSMGLISWLSGILKSAERNVHLLVTSRPESDIKSGIMDFARTENIISINDNITDDIGAYVRARVRNGKGFQRWRSMPEVQDEIEKSLMEKADGILVILVEEEDSYLEDPQDDNYGCTVLQLAHFSVKEYLVTRPLDDSMGRNFQDFVAQGAMATVCLAYLLQFDYRIEREDHTKLYPFFQYSVDYWPGFARVAESGDPKLRGFIHKLFDSGNAYQNFAHAYGRYDRLLENPKLRMPPLYFTGQEGLQHSLQRLLDHGADIEDNTGQYGTVLTAACYRGQEAVVERLLSYGANVNAEGGSYGSALQEACRKGHEKIVKLLILHGANINAQSGFYGFALQAACFRVYENIVKLLILHGANINAEGGSFGSALQAACFRGHENIVKLLILHGANINAHSGIYGTALQIACIYGHDELVQLLLSSGADVNAKVKQWNARSLKKLGLLDYSDLEPVTALQIACAEGHEGIVKRLINHGADVHARGERVGTALSIASANQHENIVEYLKLHGAKD
ncbi:Ankyrin-1 [Arthrobotrys entomopaga]|nr:Ankyrin-1 [Arthrobotrys entomopaga]